MEYTLGKNSLNHPSFREATILGHVAAIIDRSSGKLEAIGSIKNEWGESVKNDTIIASVHKVKGVLGKKVKTKTRNGEVYVISR